MVTSKQTQTSTILPVFEQRSYGGKFILNKARTLISIDPRKNTAAGIESKKLKNGLRGHANEALEHITVLRFADDSTLKAGANPTEAPFIYRFENSAGKIQEAYFTLGDEFFSVEDNGNKGFWHVLENRSGRPILLMVRVIPSDLGSMDQADQIRELLRADAKQELGEVRRNGVLRGSTEALMQYLDKI